MPKSNQNIHVSSFPQQLNKLGIVFPEKNDDK